MSRVRGAALFFLLAPLLAIACQDQKASIPKVTPTSRDSEDERRARMVETQIVARGVRDARVLAAMRQVPRHLFVEAKDRAQAYEDHPLPIAGNQTISQPYIVALMTELADLTPNEKVLEIGTGSGYQSAVLSRLAAEVYSVEIVPELARASAERPASSATRTSRSGKATAIAAGPSTRLSTRSSSRPRPTESRSRCSTSSRRAGAWSSRSAASSRS